MDLVFNKFWLPDGGKLFVYNKTSGQTIGGITNEFLNGNKDNPTDFSTGMIIGDELTLEYYQPSSLKDKPIISISKIYYGYRDIPSFSNIQTMNFGDSGDCQVNINCSEGQNWQKEKQAVARILVKLPNGSGWCSGSLVNNTSYTFEPLFLTANHCFDNVFDAINNPNLSQWIFYWNYEFPGCNNLTTEPVIRSTTGATVRANNDVSDFGLLELTQDPRNLAGFTPYYLGWDRSGSSGTEGVGIHHPRGDVKKIATYNTAPTNSTCVNNNYWMTGFIETTPNRHSVMEPGSSGSPLINSQKKLIGQLFGPGNTTLCPEHLCGNDPGLQRVSYGKFSISWTGNGALDSRRRLQDWLDPNGLNPQTLDGNDIPAISGPSQICDQGTYTIDNLPTGATVVWSATPSGVVLLQQNGNSVTLTKVGSGQITLSATINNSYNVTKSDIQVGTSPVFFNLYLTSCSCAVIEVKVGESSYFAPDSPGLSTNDTDYWWGVTPPDASPTTYYYGARLPYTAYVSGLYTVSLSYKGACGWSTPVSQNFNFSDGSLLSLYPNPTSSEVTVSVKNSTTLESLSAITTSSTSSATSYSVKVVDVYGSIIYADTKIGKQFSIPTTALRNGVYSVIVSDGTNIYQNKLIVKH